MNWLASLVPTVPQSWATGGLITAGAVVWVLITLGAIDAIIALCGGTMITTEARKHLWFALTLDSLWLIGGVGLAIHFCHVVQNPQ